MSVVNKKRLLSPPDGGWGYFICLAVTIIYATTSMFMTYFGLLFGDFLKKVEMSSSNQNLLNSLSIAFGSISGFVTSPLLKLMSTRKVALIGAVMYNTGELATVFVETQVSLIICLGIVRALGVGVMYNIGATMINEYFVEKRFLMFSIVQSVTAAIIMMGPYLITWMMQEFGYRGSLLLVSGVSLQTLVATALMQPVHWHMKEREADDKEEIKLLVEGEKMAEKSNQSTGANLIESDGNNEEKVQDDDVKGSPTLWWKLIKCFSIIELRSFLLSNALIGSSLTLVCDLTFSLMLPQALQAMEWDEAKISNALFLTGLGDMVGRLSFIFLNKWLSKIGVQEVYIVGMLVAFVARLGMIWSAKPTAVMFFVTLIGVCRCVIMILPPLIIAEVVPPELFAAATGVSMLTVGLISLVLGPTIGAIRDLTGSYATVFYIMASFFLIVVIFWTIELFYKRNKHKRQRTNLDSIK